MKKYKNRGLFLSFAVMAIVLSAFSFHDVMAADDADTICKQKLANTKFSWDDSKQELSEDRNTITLYVKSHDGKQYDFDIQVDYKIGNSTDQLKIENQKTGTTISIPTKYNGKQNVVVNITATLVSSLEVTENGTKYDCSRNFVLEASYRFEGNNVEEADNPSYYGICARYKSGQLSKDDLKLDSKFSVLNGDGRLSYSKVSSVNVNGTSGAALLDNLFSYCAKAKVESVYSDKQVLNQLYNAASIVINRGQIQEVSLPNSESEGFVKLNPENKISLTCDAFANAASGTLSRYSNIRKFYSTSSDKNSMEFHYTPKTSKKADVCSVECVEQVTVSYGPPVAVKAGLCFEYEVEIRSKVTCTSKILTEPPKIEDYKVCTPNAYCNNSGSYYFDQAGPNEEFESCITSCDGGKYSQSCINQCYNKVYGKKNSINKKTTLALSEASVQKLANSSNPSWCTVYNYDKKDNSKNPNTVSEASEVASAYRGGIYGGYYYYSSDSTINWKEYDSTYTDAKRKLADGTVINAYPGCYWNGYGRYYFLNSDKGVRTVLNDQHIRVNHNDGNDYLYYWLYYPNNGFKSSKKCNDNCEWLSSCDGYLNEVSPTGTSSAYNAYYKDLDTYNTTLQSCAAKAKCSETEAKYTMTVNNTTGEIKTCEVGTDNYDKNGNGTCKSWIESSDKKTEITTDSKNNIITKEVSGVCASKKTPNNDDYKTVISFPGSYINNKNGTVKFTIPESEKDFYTYKNGEYCVPLNAKNVNIDWWIWDQVNKRSQETKADVKTTQMTDTVGVTYNHYNGTYNILARLEKFGYLDWKVDVSCFYAVSNNSNPDTPGTDKGDDDSSTSTRFPENQDIKAAALDDLFPAKDTSANATGTSNTEEVQKSTKVSKLNYTSKKDSVTKLADSSTSANRTVGYNWSCDATNLGIKNYWIAPTSLIKKIQTQGDNVYTDSSERDFHIKLTKTNITNIRSDYKNKKYNNFGTGKYDNNQNDIVFYKSAFLSNTNYVSNFSVSGPSEKLCNNMRDGKCDSSFIVQSDSCVKLNEWLSKN